MCWIRMFFVSGVFFTGPPYQILKAWRAHQFRIVISPEIFEEYRRIGEALADQFPEVDPHPILDFFAGKAAWISDQMLPEPVCDDPDDDKFLACAIAGKCNVIVSGDKHVLKVSGYRGIEVVRPRKFVDEYL
ncbi:MAG: putative toxin-antitoxin system toxin component, PIN family [Candidatus Latescibacteria bacterium]|nr:putative toxin-antitoxin system toxin component, PIN family [Candidatus Latescibacterota bacterium]